MKPEPFGPVSITKKFITVDSVLNFLPCYPRSLVKFVWGRRKKLSLLDAAKLDVPACDRVWLLSHYVTQEYLDSMFKDMALYGDDYDDYYDFVNSATVWTVSDLPVGFLGSITGRPSFEDVVKEEEKEWIPYLRRLFPSIKGIRSVSVSRAKCLNEIYFGGGT